MHYDFFYCFPNHVVILLLKKNQRMKVGGQVAEVPFLKLQMHSICQCGTVGMVPAVFAYVFHKYDQSFCGSDRNVLILSQIVFSKHVFLNINQAA